MTEDRLPRGLTVVWFTDLVGLQRLMAQDEDRAIALVRRFQAAVRAAVPAESGRFVKFIGDAALVESPSTESAVLAAATLRRLFRSDPRLAEIKPNLGLA
jgi:class 3 adenylate cyclase